MAAVPSTFAVRVRLPTQSAPEAFVVNPQDPVQVLMTAVASKVGGRAPVSLQAGFPPTILQEDAKMGDVLKPNEIVTARIRGVTDAVSRGAPGQGFVSDGKVKLIKSAEELQSILSSNPRVVVDFFADWCGPCKHIAPQLDALAAKHSNVRFCKVDVDALQDVAALYRIEAMPTLVFLSNGREVKRVRGADMGAITAAVQAL